MILTGRDYLVSSLTHRSRGARRWGIVHKRPVDISSVGGQGLGAAGIVRARQRLHETREVIAQHRLGVFDQARLQRVELAEVVLFQLVLRALKILLIIGFHH